jgi:DNA-binding NarL/FixJ family response regulator
LSSTHRTRVLLVDDHQSALRKFAHILKAEFHVAGWATSGLDGVRAALELRPDVVTMDLFMPDIDGLEAARRICTSGSHARIIFLAAHSDSDYLAAAMKAGASGYVLKSRAAEDLVAAIRSALIGRVFISPGAETDTQ